ncbi:T9SS type A sorting domain-containing protein [bacterium]|nr:T9SS type A sorting domain-containing protein [bacterium]
MTIRNVSTVVISSFLLFAKLCTAAASLPDNSSVKSSMETSVNSLWLSHEGICLNRNHVTIDGQTFETLSIPGEGVVYEEGKPILPAIRRFVVVPPQTGLELIVHPGEERRVRAELPPVVYYEGDQILLPPPSLPGKQRVIEEDEAGELYPPNIAEMSSPIVIRGVRLVKVTTYPVQFDPSTRTYIQRNHIKAEIRYTNDEPVNPAYFPNRRNRSRTFLKFIEGLAVNGDQVRRDQPDDSVLEYVGHYLIVTHESCLEYAAPFIEWRRKSGYKVDILSLPDNIARNNPNSIEDRIQDRYDAYLDEGLDPFDHMLLIGDRESYNYGPDPNSVLDAPEGETLWGSGDHADYYYACLEGNDRWPDVGFSRWPNGSRDLMELVVGKTLAYETEPPLDEPEYFHNVGVYAQHWGNSPTTSWHPSIMTNVHWGEEVLKYLGFQNIDVYEDFNWDQQGQRIGAWIRDHYNEGTNLLIGRAQNYFWRSNFNGVNDNDKFTFDLNIAEFHWTAENSFRTGDGNHLKGPVVITNVHSEPTGCVAAMGIVWLELVKGVLLNDLPLGWGRVQAITAFEAYFPNIEYRNQQFYLFVKTDVDAFGDPGIQPWIGVPTVVDADFRGILHPETRVLNVRVSEHENNDLTVEGAQVTIYHPGGDMPEPDSDEYAEYDGMFMMTTTSDEEGMARFILPEEMDLEPGTMFLTVSGRDILPSFNEIEIGQPENFVELGEYDLFEIEGNDDGNINPGEQFVLLMEAVNLSDDNVAEDVTAVLRCPSQWVELQGEEINFGDLDPGETLMGDEGAIINISSSCPDGASRPVTRPVIEVEFSTGDIICKSAIMLDISAPNIEVVEVIEGEILDTEPTEVDLVLHNIGSIEISDFEAELRTTGIGASVTVNSARFNSLDVDEQGRISGDPFVVAGNAMFVPGTRIEMLLIIHSDDDFVDSAYFELQVGEEEENAPTGPDDYGYVCYDDTDEDWEPAPEYHWIEISSEADEADFEGELIDFDGRSQEDIGEALVIDLPFSLKFYGQEYDQVTVATNGFICPGSQERIVNFDNWPLDRGFGGGMGMIAPFWDDLRLNNGGVYYFYDEEDGRFIVEWYEIDNSSGTNIDALTFEVILYDPDIWPTYSGDADIIFQYRHIENLENMRQGDTEWADGNPYASVGISSPDGSTGISYTWAGEYPVSAAPLDDERVIRFSTMIRLPEQGWIGGYVTDAATEEPLPRVWVSTVWGQGLYTDTTGFWEMEGLLTDYEFEVNFHKPGWNDSLLTGFELENPEDSIRIDVALLHPEFRLSTERIETSLSPGLVWETEFELFNDGNGTLEWSVEKRLPDNAQFDPWELRQSYSVSDTVHDTRIEGVVFVDDHFYISGANIWDREDGVNMIYVLNRDGELIRGFQQPGDSRYGMRDLAWDGELLWGSGADSVYGFTPEGVHVKSFLGPYVTNSPITWDPDREVLWTAGRVSNEIVAFDTSGEEIEEIDNIPRFGLRMYGFAYWEDDPDGYSLYVFHSPNNLSQLVYKIDTENRDTMFVAELVTEDGGTPGGAQITSRFDPYNTVFVCITNNAGNDRIDMWQITGNSSWFNVTPVEGDINAGEFEVFNLTFDTFELDTFLYEGELLYTHNAIDFEMSIPVALRVSMDDAPGGDDSQLPEDFEITAVYPNPFNAQTQIMYSVPRETHVTISVYDLNGRLITTLTDETVTAGRLQVVWDGSSMASGIYFVRLSAPEITSTRKVMLIR